MEYRSDLRNEPVGTSTCRGWRKVVPPSEETEEWSERMLGK